MSEAKLPAYTPLPMPATESFIKSFDTAFGDPDKKVQDDL
jgi:hypothetical protein